MYTMCVNIKTFLLLFRQYVVQALGFWSGHDAA
jgi:hypothetical protein